MPMRRTLLAVIEGDPFRLIEVLVHETYDRPGLVSPSAVARSDSDAVGEPGGPPTERRVRHDGVVAEERDGEVDGRRVAPRVDDVPTTSGDVSLAPGNVVAEHHELDAREALFEVRHRAVEVDAGDSRIEPGNKQIALLPRLRIVAATDVDDDAHEAHAALLPVRRRRRVVDEAASLAHDVIAEGQLATQLQLDVDEVLVHVAVRRDGDVGVSRKFFDDRLYAPAVGFVVGGEEIDFRRSKARALE